MARDMFKNSKDDSLRDIKESLPEDRLIIQIEKPNLKLTLMDIKEILYNTGVNLDENYGPYCVNPKLGRYVVRGTANAESQKKLRRIPGITLFLDKKIEPMDK